MTSVNSCEEEDEGEADDHRNVVMPKESSSLSSTMMLSDEVFIGDGEANDSVYSVASCSLPTSSCIHDESLVSTVFYTCDVDKRGLVNVSSLMNYIRHTLTDDDDEQTSDNLDELWTMFDPNGCDIEVDHDTYRSVMMEWIERLKGGGGTGSRITTPDGSPTSRRESIMSRDLIAFSPCSPSRNASSCSSSSPSRLSDRRFPSLNCTFGSIEGRGGEHSISDEVEMADEIKELSHKYRNAVEQKEKSDRSLAASEELYIHILNERDELQKKLVSLQSVAEKSRSLEKELEEVRESLINCEETRLAAEQRSAALLKENQLLECRVKELDEEVMSAYNKIENLSVALEGTNQECEQRKANLEHYTEALNLAEDKLEKQKKNISKLEENLSESQFKIQVLRNEKNDLERQLSTSHDFSYLSVAKRKMLFESDDKTAQNGAGTASESKRRKFNLSEQMPSIYAELEPMNIGKPSPLCEKPIPAFQRSLSDLTEQLYSRRLPMFRELRNSETPMFFGPAAGNRTKRKRRLTSGRSKNVDGDEGVSSRDEDEDGSTSSDDGQWRFRTSRGHPVEPKFKRQSEELRKQMSGAAEILRKSRFEADNVLRLCVLLQVRTLNDDASDVATQLSGHTTLDDADCSVRFKTRATSTNTSPQVNFSNKRSLDSDVESTHSRDECPVTSSKDRLVSELEALRLQLVKSHDILTILTQATSPTESELRPVSSCRNERCEVPLSQNSSRSSSMDPDELRNVLTEQRSTGLTVGHLPHAKTQSLDHGQSESLTSRRNRQTVSCPILPNHTFRVTKHSKGSQTEQIIGSGHNVAVSSLMSGHGNCVFFGSQPVAARPRSNSFLRAVSKENINDTDQCGGVQTGHHTERTLFILPEEDHERIPMKWNNCPPPYVPPPSPFSRSCSTPHLSRSYSGPPDYRSPPPPLSLNGFRSVPLTPVVYVSSNHDPNLSTNRTKTLVRMNLGFDGGQYVDGGFRDTFKRASYSRTTSDSEERTATSKEVEEDVLVTEKRKDSDKADVVVNNFGRRGSIRKQLAFSAPSIIRQDSELAYEVEDVDKISCEVDLRSKLSTMSTRPKSRASLLPDHETSETESGKGSAGGSMESDPDGGSSSSAVGTALNQASPTVVAPSDEPFPNLTDTLLRKLSVHRDSETTDFVQMSDIEIENKFQSLALAVNADKFTIDRRLELHQRQRDLAEINVEKELKSLSDNLDIVRQSCSDSEGVENVTKLQNQVEVLRKSSNRLLSRGEVYGATQQEDRVIRMVELMVTHVENVKRKNDKLRNDLNETRRIVSEGITLRSSTSITPKILSCLNSYRRRASLATISPNSSSSSSSLLSNASNQILPYRNGEVRRSSAGATMQSVTTGHHDTIRLQRSSTREEDEQSIISYHEAVEEMETEIENVDLDPLNVNDDEYDDGNDFVDDEGSEDDYEKTELDINTNRRRNFSLQAVTLWWQERRLMSDFARHCASSFLILVALCGLVMTLLPSNSASNDVRYQWVSWEEYFDRNVQIRYKPNVAPPI